MTNPWPDDYQPESRYTRPRPDCPHPERWLSTDPDSTELEVSYLVGAMCGALRPDLAVETGTAFGQTAEQIGGAIGPDGQLVTFETDLARVEIATERCKGLPVRVVPQSSLAGIQHIVNSPQRVGFAWLDSLLDLRVQELRALQPALTPGAVVGMHDTGPQHPLFGQLRTELPRWRWLNLPTPRGVAFLQWGG